MVLKVLHRKSPLLYDERKHSRFYLSDYKLVAKISYTGKHATTNELLNLAYQATADRAQMNEKLWYEKKKANMVISDHVLAHGGRGTAVNDIIMVGDTPFLVCHIGYSKIRLKDEK